MAVMSVRRRARLLRERPASTATLGRRSWASGVAMASPQGRPVDEQFQVFEALAGQLLSCVVLKKWRSGHPSTAAHRAEGTDGANAEQAD